MKRFRFLSAALAGTFVYVLFSVVAGRDGFLAERQQREQKRILAVQTQSIQKINNQLQLEYTALQNDSQVIEGLAKKLGYVSSGDKIVIITGLTADSQKLYDAGTPLRAVESEYIPEWVNKSAGVAAFLVVYLYLLAEDIRNGFFRRRKKSVFMEGIPVYDLPQI